MIFLINKKILLDSRAEIVINRKMQLLYFKGFGFGSAYADVGVFF